MGLNVGSIAPEFTLKNTEGVDISLNELREEGPVVLFFFPLAFSGVCTKELCSIRDNMKMYESFNANIAGISVDSFFALNAFKRTENLNFHLLSDFNKKVSKLYDSFYEQYFDMTGVAKRSVFVIDRKGVIRYSQILEDSGNLPDFKNILKTLQSID